MTLLTKKLKRESDCMVWERGRPRPIIVTLYPSGLIGFRAKGIKKEFYLTIETAYMCALKAEVLAREHKQKKRKGSR